ncbi:MULTISPECIES: phage virion morphogenesis protein [Methylococcus]|uniref:Phage virion morphogenesis protein n=1 Tax=Methylococcus capsulatus TaxID=414 RepID=A0AA35V2X4_METCP|nr:phage virion morphogenesis protein [Methylococcus capsulatus]CAI8741881.1 Phage virion morphogenesis protein [Methylococcus capsulatus]
MAGTFIRVDDENARKALAELVRLIGNPEPALRDIGAYLERSHDERFAAGEAPDGSKWAPLSESYRAIKPQHRDKVLVLEGHLRNSLHYQVEDDGLLFGTDRIYGAVHQFGAAMGEFGRYYQLSRLKYDKNDFRRHAGSKKGHPIPWGDIPARPFVGLSDADREEIAAILEEHIQAAIG